MVFPSKQWDTGGTTHLSEALFDCSCLAEARQTCLKDTAICLVVMMWWCRFPRSKGHHSKGSWSVKTLETRETPRFTEEYLLHQSGFRKKHTPLFLSLTSSSLLLTDIPFWLPAVSGSAKRCQFSHYLCRAAHCEMRWAWMCLHGSGVAPA